MLTDADVLEYQQLYEKKFGVALSLEEARKRANALISLLTTLSQPKQPHQLVSTQFTSKSAT